MHVELCEVRPGFYFALGNQVVTIRENDYTYITELIKYLSPIPLNVLRLSRLGFRIHYSSHTGEHAHNGVVVYVKEHKDGRWLIQFMEQEKIRYIRYVHELQEFWYGCFGDLLQKNGPEISAELIMPIDQQRFYFVGGKYIFCPKESASFELEESNYGPTITYKGKGWRLQQHMGNPPANVMDEAYKWLKAFLVPEAIQKGKQDKYLNNNPELT